MPIPCFVANWKMNKTIAEAYDYLSTLEKQLPQLPPRRWEAILAPPFTALAPVSEFLERSPLKIGLAAQNVHFEERGAYTGEISVPMVREVGCQYVIIGHSERRLHFGETDEQIHRKLKACLKAGLTPLLCIGESLQERREGKTWCIIERQLHEALGKDYPGGEWVLAYEPIWAIGTGETPHPSEVEAVHQQIRDYFRSEWGEGSKMPRILYGGSVDNKNIESFMKEPSIDGVLVGGASLSADSFVELIELGTKAKSK